MQAALKKFIREFLPKNRFKGKYSHNEFRYVRATIEKIFARYGNIEVTEAEFAQCLSEEGYRFYAEEKPFGRIKTAGKRKTGNGDRKDAFWDYGEDAFLFVGVSSHAVFELRKAANSMALQKDKARIEQLVALRKRIKRFFSRL